MMASWIADELLGPHRDVNVLACRADMALFGTTAGFATDGAPPGFGGAAMTLVQLTLLVTDQAVLLFSERRLAGWAPPSAAEDAQEAWSRLPAGGVRELQALLTGPDVNPCPVATADRS